MPDRVPRAQQLGRSSLAAPMVATTDMSSEEVQQLIV